MILMCITCGAAFDDRQFIYGKERHLHGRRQCLQCLPFKPRRSPSFVARRPPKVMSCANCGKSFPAKAVVKGKLRSLYRRRFCLECSPFGVRNRALMVLEGLTDAEIAELRRKRRNAKTYRHQKKKRRSNKLRLIELAGGACVACRSATAETALEFHHRDATTKDFAVGSFTGSWTRLIAEVAKCDLLCANCHRLRHAVEKPPVRNEQVSLSRLERKLQAVVLMGSACGTCGRSGPSTLFEFHHRDASEKSFGISQDGVMRSWAKVVAELAKCVMLCANCHREVHAGVRELPPTVSEDAPPYAA